MRFTPGPGVGGHCIPVDPYYLAWRAREFDFIDRFIEALRQIEGAYSLVALTNKKLIGARDPLGIRPLVIGELDGKYILASESCALDLIGEGMAALLLERLKAEMAFQDHQREQGIFHRLRAQNLPARRAKRFHDDAVIAAHLARGGNRP